MSKRLARGTTDLCGCVFYYNHTLLYYETLILLYQNNNIKYFYPSFNHLFFRHLVGNDSILKWVCYFKNFG